MGRKNNSIGFTLVELLVVIAIISILAGLLLPVLEDSLESARKVACLNNQKQIGVDFMMYIDDNGFLPSHNRDDWPTNFPLSTYGFNRQCATGEMVRISWGLLYLLPDHPLPLANPPKPLIPIIRCPSKDDPNKQLMPFCWRSQYLLRVGGTGTGSIQRLNQVRPQNALACDLAVYLPPYYPLSNATQFGSIAHEDGWNVLYYDASARWVVDPGNNLYTASVNGAWAAYNKLFWDGLENHQ